MANDFFLFVYYKTAQRDMLPTPFQNIGSNLYSKDFLKSRVKTFAVRAV